MFKLISLSLALSASVQAHMQLHYPPAFGAENNPHRTDPVDEFITYPYNCCGRTMIFPCNGYLDLLGTDQGRSVATWEAGSAQNFSLTGWGTHYGGSCQAGFSTDQGKTWKVVSSYEGNCPHRNGGAEDPGEQTFEFNVPADTPEGDHVFAWTWFNREQEFFMNCAPVTVTGGSGGSSDSQESIPYHKRSSHSNRPGGRLTYPTDKREASSVPFDERPGFLVANIDNGCKTPRSNAEVKFPNPGPDVVEGDGEYPLERPEGSCEA